MMQGIRRARIFAVHDLWVLGTLLCVLSLAKALDDDDIIGGLGGSTATDPAPPGCPGEGANTLTQGWTIIIKNTCPTNTIRVAVSYKANGQWRDVGYWTLPPQESVPVALTNNRYFVYYAESTVASATGTYKHWAGDYCLKPCGASSVCGRQEHIGWTEFGEFELRINC
jgi:hypothetical protein